MEKINVLKRIPIFSNMGQEELSGLAEKAIRKKFSRDTIVVSEGDDGDSLMIILSGQVKVTLLSEDGKEIIVADTADAFAQAVINLLKHPSKRADLSAAGQRSVEAKYDWSAIVLRLENAYARAIQLTGSGPARS